MPGTVGDDHERRQLARSTSELSWPRKGVVWRAVYSVRTESYHLPILRSDGKALHRAQAALVGCDDLSPRRCLGGNQGGYHSVRRPCLSCQETN